MLMLSQISTCNRDTEVLHTHYANSPLEKSICFVMTLEYIEIANKNPNISAVITTQELSEQVDENKGLIISGNPKKLFFELHNKLLEEGYNSMNVSHYIDKTAQIAESVKIYGNVKIGKNVIIEDFVVVNSNIIIEDNVYIAQNVVLGARGMHNTMIDDKFVHVKDAGGVHISQGCEVLAGAIIQKSYFAEFVTIGEQSKISVGVKIGHGCNIGKRTLIAGSTQIAGYNNIGDDVWIGPSSVLAHGLSIGNKAQIKLGSVVVKDVKEAENISGNFAYNHAKRIRNFVKEQR